MRKLFSPFRVVIRFITEISKNKSYPKENCFSDTHFLPLKVPLRHDGRKKGLLSLGLKSDCSLPKFLN